MPDSRWRHCETSWASRKRRGTTPPKNIPSSPSRRERRRLEYEETDRMPLAPAPLLPGTSPLPTPGRRPPDRRAQRLGALAALPTLLVALLAGQFILPHIVFVAPGLQAQASGAGVRPGTRICPGVGFHLFHPPRGDPRI